MSTYTFDIKLFASAHVRAASKKEALAFLRETADSLDLGLVAVLPCGGEVSFASVTLDGEPDYVGIWLDTLTDPQGQGA
jgi:hypothetical protein